MQTATTLHLNQEQDEKTKIIVKKDNFYSPLDKEARPAIPTDAAAYYLNRKSQTLRAWACLQNGPIRPIRINGRLAWKVSEIKALLAGGS